MKQFNKDSLDYNFIDKFESGIVLSGADVKSLRTQTVQYANSKINIIDGIPFIENLKIPIYKYSHGQVIDTSRSRQLLLKEKEIAKLISYKHQKYSIIPISIFLHGHWFKLEIGVGRKVKKYEKREKIKAREFQRGKI
jgi:SsrA-binding protein